MSRSVGTFLGALIVLALGFTVGFMRAPRNEAATASAPEAVVAEPASVPSAPSGSSPRPDVEARLEKQEEENQRLERRLRELELGLAAARSSAGTETPQVMLPPSGAQTADAVPPEPDVPLPFPTELSEAYTPKGFEDVTLRSTRECGMPLSVVAIDCSEFPCIAWTRVTGPNETGEPFSMDSCGPWAEVFKDGTMVIGSVTRADVEPREVYFAWMALPEQEDLVRPAMARARQRTAEISRWARTARSTPCGSGADGSSALRPSRRSTDSFWLTDTSVSSRAVNAKCPCPCPASQKRR